MKKHTLLESAIDRKNHYQGRMAENMTNIIYFTKRKAELEKARDMLKQDSEERGEMNKQVLSAQGAIDSGKDNVEADKMLLESFEELISSLE